jgi:uncharacterized protein YndB with AHSA1/START domain
LKSLLLAGSVVTVLVVGSMVTGSEPTADSEESYVVLSDRNPGRTLHHEIVVEASLEDVWEAWTTNEGINSFLSPHCDVELKIGGKYEIYFDMSAEPGLRGAEGCHVLSYLPMEMLSYEWNAPPSIPGLRSVNAQTWVVMQFVDLGDGTVRIEHTMLGIGEGEDWDKYIAYFERAWTNVLAACKKRFDEGPVDWSEFE